MGRGHEGKIAVVTGAANGIGQALAQRLAEDGLDIAIADLADPQETGELVQQAGRRVLTHAVDVSRPEDIERFKHAVLDAFGRVDVLVNNAGIYPRLPWREIEIDAWRRVMAVNVEGAFLTCRAFVPGMQEHGWGRVVNICSTAVLVGEGSGGYLHYVASKSALLGLTRGLATEVGEDGVTVNAILPGLTRTETTAAADPPPQFDVVASLQAIKRVGVAADLAGALSFLTSDDAAFITGQALVVDGGYVRH